MSIIDEKQFKDDFQRAFKYGRFEEQKTFEQARVEAINAACDRIGEKIEEHLAVYGDDYESRLTGAHETCSYKEFRYGAADRTASIRIPRNVALEGMGYLEDRRPNANADPYRVASRMLKTVCEIN